MPIPDLMRHRLREESGFGLLELLMAIVMLNVGILAILGAFNAGAVALTRANRVATAATLADQQMELYRGMKYPNIEFITSEYNLATADSTYTADAVWTSNGLSNPQSPKGTVPTVTTCPNTSTNSCDPSYVTNGPDGHPYRVDTYLYFDQKSGSEQVKIVTVVVRDANSLSMSLARQSTTFDQLTGQ